ncbi:hypothetical protein ACIBQ1_10075 [Nonomuraea sp. NPDC050153]|uniref:hypothetical protein n=1 Tax=Nonomuraea sp. NPDC050153 TaxID=3364359 RepID=UPI0037ADA19E
MELALQDEAGEVEGVVYEGEIVSDVPERSSRLPSVVVEKVTVLRPSPKTQKRARAAGRHGALVLAGWHSWLVRMYDGLTNGTIREQIRISKATGDREALAFWLDKRREAKNDRYERLMKLPLLALKMAILSGGCLLAVPVLLVIVSTVVWMTGAGEWTDPWGWLGGVLRWMFGALAFAWSVFVAALPFLLIWAGHRAGRRNTELPTWLVDPDKPGEARNVLPDESAILHALRHMSISQLNKALKAGWRPRFVLGTARDGEGYRTQLELPAGVTVEMIVQKKKVLAHNLVRYPVEVWPTEPKPGVLDLWVADQGALTGPVPAWPLLTKGTADYFEGVPVAVDIRGNVVIALLFETNYAYAGVMGSGKSSMIITTLLGAMLDPIVEIDVHVMANNSDYDPMEPRLRTLATGQGLDVVEACFDNLRGIYNGLEERGEALKDHKARKVTRELALKEECLRPRVAVIDECQALFMHDKMGEEAIDITKKTIMAARKYGVTLKFATPEPSDASLPRAVMAVVLNKACFAIGDQRSNDAILGTGSYKMGISAVGLKPKTKGDLGDIGTCMARGFQSEPGLLRSFFVPFDQEKGVDMVTPVVERALGLREKAGIAAASASSMQVRDLLEDMVEVVRQRTRLSDAASLLRDLAPAWMPYQGLTGARLRDILVNKHGVRVTNTGNVPRVEPEDLREALATQRLGE